MTPARTRRPARPNMRRAVLLFPSGLTLGNLFFGVFAIITASRGDFREAGIWVLWGGICDALDGRVARATNAGSQFGEELDSLVDAISFGLAPAMIMYFAVLNRGGWDWVFVFAFCACAVMRLARFNIEQAGTAKTYFQGLPSPAAGCTLASYYWFSQSDFYQVTAIGHLPWQQMLRFLMVGLAFLMISNVPYPVFPRTGFRSIRALLGSLIIVTALFLLWSGRLEWFFPLTLAYVALGLLRWILSGLFERRQPTIPYDLSEGEDEELEDEEFEQGSSQVHLARQGHREARPPREDRQRKHRDVTGEKAVVSAPRAEGREPGAKPQRTEAERAERAERKQRREERDQQRKARLPREKPVVSDATFDAVTPVDEEADPILGAIPGGADIPVSAGSVDDAARRARKRKRRRRRGERRPGSGEGGDTGLEGESPSQEPHDSAPPTSSSSEPNE